MKASSSGTYPRTLEDGTKPLVLLVEDYGDASEMYAFTLGREGFRVIIAVDGPEAIALASRRKVDAIVMDLNLPTMDGIEVTQRLQSDPRTWNIPVVMVTASPLPDVRARARQAGVSSFLAKPCLPAALAAEVARVLDCSRSRPPVVAAR